MGTSSNRYVRLTRRRKLLEFGCYRKKTKFFILLFVSGMVYIMICFHNSYYEKKYLAKFLSLLGNKSDLNNCELPLHYSPFDVSILPYMKEYSKQINCPKSAAGRQAITVIDEDNNILRQTDPNASCLYQLISKVDGDDDNIVISEPARMDPVFGLKLDRLENYVSVNCRLRNDQLYTNVHSWFNPSGLVPENGQIDDSDKPSVFILVVESLSRLNYLRYMPMTKQFLETELDNIHYLEGLNKIADNSYPNMMAFLSGQRAYTGQIVHDEEGPYDDNPMVWKEFHKAGYVSSLIEDCPNYTLFNYISKGFLKKPTTFYPRPMWLFLENSQKGVIDKLMPLVRDQCYDDRYPVIEILMNQAYSFVRQSKAHSMPYYSFNFIIGTTHNDFNKAQTVDKHVRDFLRRLKPYFNNTIVVLMGDHGHRFGSIMQTEIGRIESRMPLFAISLPKQLNDKHPHLEKFLERNKQRLITWTDLHLMIKDVATNHFSGNSKHPTHIDPDKVYSPWREEVSKNRSCANAKILDFYCVCDSRVSVSADVDFVNQAAHGLISTINHLFDQYPDCVPLKLHNITDAQLIFIPSEIESSRLRGTRYTQHIEVTITVLPSYGIIRGRMRKDYSQLSWTTNLEFISRIDAYGTQSYCINDRRVRAFCYCKNYTDIADNTYEYSTSNSTNDN